MSTDPGHDSTLGEYEWPGKLKTYAQSAPATVLGWLPLAGGNHSTDLEARVPELLRRYAQARQERQQLLEEVMSTVGSAGPR